MDCKVNKVRLAIGEDAFKVIDTKTEECISIIDCDSFYTVKHLLENLGIETSVEEEKKAVKLPTHNNFVKMLKDIYKFTKLSKNSEVLAADDMKFCLFGYIAYYKVFREDGELAREVSKEFTIKPTDAVKTTRNVSFPKCCIIDHHLAKGWDVENAKRRLVYCDKKLLKKLFDE